MNNYIVTFEKPDGIIETICINARDAREARFKTLNSKGKISYFHTILLNDTDEDI